MVGDAAAFRQDLGVAGMADAALVEGLLVQGQGRDGVDAAGERQLGGRREKLIRGPAGPGVDDAGATCGQIAMVRPRRAGKG